MQIIIIRKKYEYFILLSKKPIAKSEINKFNGNCFQKFWNVTYSKFLNNVEEELKKIDNLKLCDKYIIILRDFINSFNYYSERGGEMKENLKFYATNYYKINDLYHAKEDFFKHHFKNILVEDLIFLEDKINNDNSFKSLGEWTLNSGPVSNEYPTWIVFNCSKFPEFRGFEITFENMEKNKTLKLQFSTSEILSTNDDNLKLKEHLSVHRLSNGIILNDSPNHVILHKDYDMGQINFDNVSESIFDFIKNDWSPNIPTIHKIFIYAQNYYHSKKVADQIFLDNNINANS